MITSLAYSQKKIHLLSIISFFFPLVLTTKDLNVMNLMKTNFNRPWQLFLIAWPALASLAFCPAVLYLYPVLVHIFWPSDHFPDGPPNINDAIGELTKPTVQTK